MTCRAVSLTPSQISKFQRDAYLVIERLINEEWMVRLRNRIEPLFAGEFETGIYPDEWYWRKGLSFVRYLDPPEMMTCWISLDDTTKDAGTIEYVPGSVEPSPLSVDAWLVTTPVR